MYSFHKGQHEALKSPVHTLKMFSFLSKKMKTTSTVQIGETGTRKRLLSLKNIFWTLTSTNRLLKYLVIIQLRD